MNDIENIDLLDYNMKKNVNVIPKESYEKLVHIVFNTVAEILSKSYGPLGSNTIISQGRWSSTTKDGFTIFKNIIFNNKYKTMVYEQMRPTCTKLNNTVGDGTTTAILLTAKLFEKYKEYENIFNSMHLLPREFNSAWNDVISEIIENIQRYGKRINNLSKDKISKYMYDIAMISSNGNEEISRTIANVYKESDSPSIKYKNSPTNKCFMTSINGFEYPTSLFDECFCKTEDLTVDLENVKVLLFSIKIEPEQFETIIKEVNEIYRDKNQKVLVIAPSYDELMSKTTFIDYTKQEWMKYKSFNMYPTQYLFTKLYDHQMEDLAALLGCKIIDLNMMKEIKETLEENPDTYDLFNFDRLGIIGTVPKVTLSIYNGSVFKDIDTDREEYKKLLSKAEKELNEISNNINNDSKDFSMDIAKAKSRISQLKMSSYIYNIGSDSRLETGMLIDTVDDVIKACASAYKFGIVQGSQISILKACNELILKYDNKNELKEKILSMIKHAVISMYNMLIDGPEHNGLDRILYKIKNDQIIFNKFNLTYLDYDQDYLSNLKERLFNYIIDKNLDTNKTFNIVTCEFDESIIVSTETDINVLTASSELIKLLISGNQFLFRESGLDTDEVNESV